MNTTINISLPTEMYKDVKTAVKTMRYSSVSELMREALRDKIYTKEKVRYTVNGFTPEFEDEIMKSAASSPEEDYILENQKQVKDFFLHLKLPKQRKDLER
jgi:Arc/MetJ-type ribon-helix-helix transcriptional regulator